MRHVFPRLTATALLLTASLALQASDDTGGGDLPRQPPAYQGTLGLT